MIGEIVLRRPETLDELLDTTCPICGTPVDVKRGEYSGVPHIVCPSDGCPFFLGAISEELAGEYEQRKREEALANAFWAQRLEAQTMKWGNYKPTPELPSWAYKVGYTAAWILLMLALSINWGAE